MKNVLKTSATIIILIASSLFFNSCVKDTCKSSYTYSYYIPVYKTKAEVKSEIKSNSPQKIVNPGKIVLLRKYIFLNELDKGIHVIDNTNPASPRNVAFINIPGNVDIAAKGNTLYADLYTDLVTLDISDPMNVMVKNYNNGVFPFRNYGNGFYADSSKLIVDWIKKDTIIIQNCGGGYAIPYYTSVYMDFAALQTNAPSAKANSGSPVGKGGSMARFTIVNNKLYTVSNSDLNVFDISNPNDPVYTNNINTGGWNVETIFPFKDKLLLGSQNGMFIYDINDPGNPKLLGQFAHVQSCDPVIADGNYAFVTLRSGTACQGFTNQLEVLKLNSFTDPELIKTYSLTNPYGLSKDGNLLFICDGSDGLRIYNSSDVSNLKLVKHFSNMDTYDVIAYNNIALVVAKDGLYQFDYSDVNHIHLVGKTGFFK
jgi:hypothetical protein